MRVFLPWFYWIFSRYSAISYNSRIHSLRSALSNQSIIGANYTVNDIKVQSGTRGHVPGNTESLSLGILSNFYCHSLHCTHQLSVWRINNILKGFFEAEKCIENHDGQFKIECRNNNIIATKKLFGHRKHSVFFLQKFLSHQHRWLARQRKRHGRRGLPMRFWNKC